MIAQHQWKPVVNTWFRIWTPNQCTLLPFKCLDFFIFAFSLFNDYVLHRRPVSIAVHRWVTMIWMIKWWPYNTRRRMWLKFLDFCLTLRKNWKKTSTMKLIWLGIEPGAKGAVCGPMGVLLADRSTSSKHRKCHLYLPRPIHACPCHGSWAMLLAANSCKVEGASSRCSKMGIYQLRETTLTENIVLPGLLEVDIGLTTQSVKKQ